MCRVVVLLLLALPATASAHGHELVSHHWSLPQYTREMHLQMACMGGALFAAAVWVAVSRVRRSRRCVS